MERHSRPRAALLVALVCATLTSAMPPSAMGSGRVASWFEQTSAGPSLAAALRRHSRKVPTNLGSEVDFARQADGRLLVMVALRDRNPSIERSLSEIGFELRWYGSGPRFLALVDQADFAELLRLDAVAFIEPDYPLSYLLATSTIDVSARGPSGMWDFDAAVRPAGALTSSVRGLAVDRVTGKGVTVAVVDSGIDKTHRDFGGWSCTPGPYAPCESRIMKSVVAEQVLGDAVEDPGDDLVTTEFASGHGTHVAGIVAGNGYYARTGQASEAVYKGDGHVIGVAPQASLVSVKVGDTVSAALGTDALQWTLDHVEEYNIRVANNSWGCLSGCPYRPSSVLAQIQEDLYRKDVVTLFAAGNAGGDGGGSEFSGNSQNPYVLSVASYNDETDQVSEFSSRGSRHATIVDPATWDPDSEYGSRRPDIAAPGDWIHSAHALTGGTSALLPRVDPMDAGFGYGFMAYRGGAGTSMATPHVAGAAALIFSVCPSAGARDVMRALLVGADGTKLKKTDSHSSAEPYEVGYGGLNVTSSLRWLQRSGRCR